MTYKFQILFVLLLISHLFLRFHLLFEKANLTWDQVDSAWAAKAIVEDRQFLLHGPVAKGNSGIYMGPIYFYLIAIVYLFTNLDPIASPIFQGIMSIANFLVLIVITKNLFGTRVALIAGFINTFCITVMFSDRVQSGYYLIPLISYVVFYLLYKAICEGKKYIVYLAIATGLSFHVDFVSVFYPMLIFLSLPFFPRNKETIKYFLLSIPAFFIFLVPTIAVDAVSRHSTSRSFMYLFDTYYHGIHITRILQLFRDAFTTVYQVLQFHIFRPLGFLIIPLFMAIYYSEYKKRQTLILLYLIAMWTIVPWIVLSSYSGELTDYYFSLPRDIVIAMAAYLTYFLYRKKKFILTLAITIFWGVYAVNNLQLFFSNTSYGNLLSARANVRQAIKNKEIVPFRDHNLESYIYYVYTRKTKP